MQLVEQDEIPIETYAGIKGLSKAKFDKIWEAVEKKMIAVELPILTKNQKKKLKKRKSEMKKKQASAQAGDESGSSQPMYSLSQFLKEVTTAQKELLEIAKGVQSERELDMLEIAITKMRESVFQAVDLKMEMISRRELQLQAEGKGEAGLVDL